MKKFYYSLFAAASMMLAVTSCSQEEDFVQSSSEMTTFSVQLDGATQSRTAGDGKTVDKLYYAVYSESTGEVVYPAGAQYGTAEKEDGGWKLDLPLMKSETYDILFWAQKDGSGAYEFTNLKEVTVKYDGVLSNKEDRDAFFNALDGFKASGSEHTIVLRRPFAQLNVATTIDDWTKAKTIYNSTNNTTGVNPVSKSAVTVSALATKFNVLTGEASVPTTGRVTFGANTLLDESIKIKRMVEGVEKDVEYKLLAMNYLLPEGTKEPNGLEQYNPEEGKENTEVEFTLYKGTDEQIVNVKVPATPIQRNWRTNIIGDLLTGEGFDVVIEEGFDNEENQEIEISADGIVKDADGIYHITTIEGLWNLARLVNNGSQSASTGGRAATVGYTFEGETFVLDCDVDLQGEEWTPIDGFAGTFNGNNDIEGKEYKISNFKVNKAESAGLFGNLGTGATIKNLTVTDATILSNHWAGVIAGNGMCLKIENCKVENSSVTVDPTIKDANGEYNGDKAGAIIGYIAEKEAHITGCEANNVTIQAYRDLGGIVGYANGTTISGNKVNDIVLTIDNTNNYKNYTTQDEHDAGDIVGEAAINSTVADDNTATEGTVTIIYTEAEEYPGYYQDAEGNYCATANEGIEALLKNDDFWADKTEVSVILKSDLTVNVDAWENEAFGGAKTETITIDLQGNTLTFEQLNSDWSNIAAANNAKLIIKNGHITNSGYNNGPWNRHDLNFACEVELIDITTDKAIALKNDGTLTRVSISDANTSDTYALWIQPKGQTVTLDGCTIDMIDCTDGRGIKIDEQYVDAPAKVTLNVSTTTFKTEEKSAILVKSAASADITLSNIDITGVQADNVCAVWVDSDAAASFDLVNVTGGKKALEGAGYYLDGEKYYATSDAGISALIGKGQTEINLVDGSFAITTSLQNKELTFTGSRNAELDLTPAAGPMQSVSGATLSFNGITVKYGTENYKGMQHAKAVTYNDCAINGLQFLYAPTTFTNCDLNSNGAEHCVWTYGATEATFTGCDFTYGDRAVNCYSEAGASHEANVTFTDCTFTKVAGAETTGAIETNSSSIKSLALNINNCSVNEGDLWWVSEWDSKGGENTVVTLDGNRIVATPAQLNVALADATEGLEIYLGKGEFGTILAKSNKTIIGTENAKVDCVNLNGAEELTLKNIKFDAAKAVQNYDGKGNAKQYANIISGDSQKQGKGARNLVIDGCTFEGKFVNGGTAIAFTDQGRGSGQSGDITIKGCTFNTQNGYYDIYAHYSGYGYLNIEGNTFNSTVQGLPIYLGRYQSSTAVVVKGNAFNKVASFEDAAYIQAHSDAYTVSFDAKDNTFANK